jgi:hypothetical protein
MSDGKISKGYAHLSDAHLPNVDEVKSPRPRQAGSMLMASARIEVDAICKPGDPLTPVLRKHAATYAERVRTEAPAYMQQAVAASVEIRKTRIPAKGFAPAREVGTGILPEEATASLAIKGSPAVPRASAPYGSTALIAPWQVCRPSNPGAFARCPR